jgi:hypothetical protein
VVSNCEAISWAQRLQGEEWMGRNLMNMNLEYMEEKVLTGRVMTPTDFRHAQVWESARISDPFEFIFGSK